MRVRENTAPRSRWLPPLALSLLLALGCSSTSKYPTFPSVHEQLAPPAEGLGRVIVLRPYQNAPQQRIAITLGGDSIGALEAMEALYVDVPAGEYSMRAKYGLNSGTGSVVVPAGSETFVGVWMQVGAYAGRPEIALLSEEDGNSLAGACFFRGEAPVSDTPPAEEPGAADESGAPDEPEAAEAGAE